MARRSGSAAAEAAGRGRARRQPAAAGRGRARTERVPSSPRCVDARHDRGSGRSSTATTSAMSTAQRRTRAAELIEDFMIAVNTVHGAVSRGARLRVAPPHRPHAGALAAHRRARRGDWNAAAAGARRTGARTLPAAAPRFRSRSIRGPLARASSSCSAAASTSSSSRTSRRPITSGSRLTTTRIRRRPIGDSPTS